MEYHSFNKEIDKLNNHNILNPLIMNYISLPIEQIKNEYDVVVIGSGYGGSIAASRLSRAGKKVCLIERGKEYAKGDFPETELGSFF